MTLEQQGPGQADAEACWSARGAGLHSPNTWTHDGAGHGHDLSRSPGGACQRPLQAQPVLSEQVDSPKRPCWPMPPAGMPHRCSA